MTERRRVFVDTSPIRHSVPGADRRARGELKCEIQLLPRIAALAKAGRFNLLWHSEAFAESLGQIRLGDPRPVLLDAGAQMVASPIVFSRTLTPPSLLDSDWKRWQVRCLKGIKHRRYLELQRALGASDPAAKNADNQLIDAFYVWCADAAGASHLLTTDFRLCNMARRTKTDLGVRVVRPSELLNEIESR